MPTRSTVRSAVPHAVFSPVSSIARHFTRRACVVALTAATALGTTASAQGLRTESVAKGLEHPWALAFLPQGRFLVTERPGRLRIVEPDGRLLPPVAGLPQLATQGQGGLLDLVLDSRFSANRILYFCFSEPGPGGNSTALARARLSDDGRRLEQLHVLFSQKPKVASTMHFGCRIVEDREGHLFLALGERFSRMDDAQRLDNHLGKVVRLTKDGAPAPGNPFAERAGALPEIWSFGHRNPQGAALGPEGRLWIHEHGPQGGDEVNLPQSGRNYGWPVVSLGVHYGGRPVGQGESTQAGMEPPHHHWTPSIAPSGMAFLGSDRYGPAWQKSLFVGALRAQLLVRLELDGQGGVVREERWPVAAGRVRDVRQGPDGWLYLLTDEQEGQLLRVLPP